MDFKKQNIQNYFLYDTQVENLFLSEYLPSAPENAVKVYLLALMHAQQGLPADNAALAGKLHISAAEVDTAWDYWYKCGVVRLLKKAGDQSPNYSVEFLNIREMVFGRGTGSSVPAAAAPFALDDDELRRLLSDIETTTGRLLEAREAETVASWIAEFGMSPDVILMGYKYCTDRRKSNRLNYVGTVLKEWRAKGLVTVEQVEDNLALADRHYEYYRAVVKELGFHRSASEPEKRIMDSWFDKMGFSLEEVMQACQKTTGISSPNINYVNSILVSKYNEKNGGKDGTKPAGESLFARVNALYEKIREENARKTEQTRSEVFTKIPRIKNIIEEIRDCGVAVSRGMLRGGAGSAEVAKQRQKIAALNSEKEQLLLSHGYSADALDAVYSCPKCRDTGVLDDGSRCSCFSEKAEMLIRKTQA